MYGHYLIYADFHLDCRHPTTGEFILRSKIDELTYIYLYVEYEKDELLSFFLVLVFTTLPLPLVKLLCVGLLTCHFTTLSLPLYH